MYACLVEELGLLENILVDPAPVAGRLRVVAEELRPGSSRKGEVA